MSIAASGYFDHEPLQVVEEDNHTYVIEGNRRLAAVKLLLDAKLRKELKATQLPIISAERAQELSLLPILRTTREKAWQFLGFKHVNGPAKWGSYAKAMYIGEVHNDYHIELAKIAEQIGDRHTTVQRLYRGLMVIEQAERKDLFHRENRYASRFYFSHIYTALDYPGFQKFLSLSSTDAELKDPVPESNLRQLSEVCLWIYGDKRNDVRPLIKSQNPDLRILEEVLQNERAVDSLRAELPLSVAHEVSQGDERIFRESLQQAKHHLQKARGTMSIGFDGQADLIKLADEVSNLAYDLADEMDRKANPTTRRRR